LISFFWAGVSSPRWLDVLAPFGMASPTPRSVLSAGGTTPSKVHATSTLRVSCSSSTIFTCVRAEPHAGPPSGPLLGLPSAARAAAAWSSTSMVGGRTLAGRGSDTL